MTTTRYLTDEQERQFLDAGFCVVPGAIDREFCRLQCERMLDHIGITADDPATWTVERLHCACLDPFLWRDIAPVAWGVINELLRPGQVPPDSPCGNGMIINFKAGAGAPWQPPGPDSPGWHKDGNFFRHFLDSPEQALLAIVIWQDIGPRGGGTFYAPDSVGHVARFLAAHPEGVRPDGLPVLELVRQCRDFREITGRAGDVILLHPYMLHAASPNPSGIPRFITNPNVAVTEPLCFDRPDGGYSVLERSILQALGVDRLDWRITGERERYAPGHLKGYEAFMQARRGAASPA